MHFPTERRHGAAHLAATWVALGACLWAGGAAAAFPECLAELRGKALASGVSARTFDTAVAGLQPDMTVIAAMDRQPEFVTPIWDYLAALVDAERIADGKRMLVRWADVLDAVEQRFGVDRHTVVAVWGVESNYGKVLGGRPLVRSLATVSCFGRRQSFFRNEFVATLQILERGDVAPERLVGSWAGAFGQTQFMPTTFQRLAVDFDGDGRRDIAASVPDALGSTANYLARAGWRTGEPWGYEVRVPADYRGPAGRRNRKPLADFAALGVKRLDGSALSGPERAALVLPTGIAGPAFIVFRNYDAIYSYNAAESYAIAIAHLSDRLRGLGPIATRWPTDDPGLSRSERREVQSLLIRLGYDIGDVDGLIGTRTREAIEDFQNTRGMTGDGRASAKLLEALRAAPVPAGREAIEPAPAGAVKPEAGAAVR